MAKEMSRRVGFRPAREVLLSLSESDIQVNNREIREVRETKCKRRLSWLLLLFSRV
jgi:hypothetical protein